MILGIESSCDESALALFDEQSGLAGEWVHSQIAVHENYGGIVPDLASREHLNKFPLLLEKMQLTLDDKGVDRIAVTCGPGLAGCLAIGLALAKSLALAWQVSLVGVNHLRGHAYSPFIPLHQYDPSQFDVNLQNHLPHLGLIVSGGNTILFKLNENRSLDILAQTVDDAAGEALDKGAKLLGMKYPGGPLIEECAQRGNNKAFDFPRAYFHNEELKFSFSGLKTSLRYRLEKINDDNLETLMPDICASYQEAVVQALARKTEQALSCSSFASLGLSGGVANNKRLREVFTVLAQSNGLPLYIAEPAHTGDNAAMIAFAAYADPSGTIPTDNFDLSFLPSLTLSPQNSAV